jgi:hypothetical protein
MSHRQKLIQRLKKIGQTSKMSRRASAGRT